MQPRGTDSIREQQRTHRDSTLLREAVRERRERCGKQRRQCPSGQRAVSSKNRGGKGKAGNCHRRDCEQDAGPCADRQGPGGHATLSPQQHDREPNGHRNGVGRVSRDPAEVCRGQRRYGPEGGRDEAYRRRQPQPERARSDQERRRRQRGDQRPDDSE